MKVYLGNFNKVVNSTKKVRTSTLSEYELVLKDGCDIITPSFKLLNYSDDMLKNVNYAVVPAWNRSYFIKNMTILPGKVLEIDMTVDVMGTYSDDITSSTLFVKRSRSEYNKWLPDDCWSHTTQVSTEIYPGIFDGYNSQGTYIIQTISSFPTGAYPSMSTYAMNDSTLKKLISYVFSSGFYDKVLTGASSESKSIAKTFFNPFQYVVSCKWFPLAIDNFPGADETVSFGWWDSGIVAKGVSRPSLNTTLNFKKSIPCNNWTDIDNRWTNILCYVPGFGTFNIDACYAGTTITGEISSDISSGTSVMKLKSFDKTIMQVNGKLGVSVQLSSLYKDIPVSNSLTSTLSSMGSTLLTAGLSALDAGLRNVSANVSGHEPNSANRMSNAVGGALAPTPCLNGSPESIAQLKTWGGAQMTVRRFYNYHSEDVIEKMGGMLNRTKTLSELSGYTEVAEPKVHINGTLAEKNQLEILMSGGFYIE